MTRVGLLSAPGHPLLPSYTETVSRALREPIALVLDSKAFSDKDRRIFADRTQGRFPERPVPASAVAQVLHVPDHNSPECLQAVRDSGLRLLINAGTPRRIGPALLAALPHGVLNVHPGILPWYRGASCCEWALHYDHPVGVTAHFMDEGLDQGPILFSRTLAIRPGDSYEDVRVGLYHLVQQTAGEAADRILADGIRPQDLPPQGPGTVHRPIPDDLLAVVRAKLAAGRYRPTPLK